MATAPKLPVTSDEYLAAEHGAVVRSEFLNGKVYAMAGASQRHVLLTTNLVIELSRALPSCRVYSTDMRLSIRSGIAYVYPDVMVTCESERFLRSQTDTLENPVLIVEVLSRTTKNYDRGEKFMHYRTIPSLREYFTVEQDRVFVEHYTYRPQPGEWVLKEYAEPDAAIALSTGGSLEISRLYRNLEGVPEEE